MLSTIIESAKLFVAGRLFRENGKALRQLAIGTAVGAVTVVLVGQVAPIWAAAVAGGLVSGGLQPFLFKDLKYA